MLWVKMECLTINNIQHQDSSEVEKDSEKYKRSYSAGDGDSSTSYGKEKFRRDLTSNHIANMVKESPSDLGDEQISSP